MENAFWLKGMIVGFVLCAPLGPVGMLCIQRWSPILVTASSLISPVLQPGHLTLINRVCGAVIFFCGLLLGVAPLVAPSM
jgi:arginine exporter protein ArgO